MKIFSGTANEPLARAICKSVGCELGKCNIKPFPDGETFVKIEENVRGEEVFIIQPTSPPTNHNLMELFIMIDALRRASAKRITAVMPFYGYARQDRKDQPRVPITAKLVANLLVAAGANRMLTIDLHAQQIQGFFDIPVDHLYAAPVMYDYLRRKNLKDLVVVSPDVGGLKMAHAYSQVLGGGPGHRRQAAQKRHGSRVHGRHRRNQGQKHPAGGRFDGDGGHADAGGGFAEEKGREEHSGLCFPCHFERVGIERLRKSVIDELITTDTVQRPPIDGVKIVTLSVAGLLGEAIKRIHSNSSVNSLFEFKGGRTS